MDEILKENGRIEAIYLDLIQDTERRYMDACSELGGEPRFPSISEAELTRHMLKACTIYLNNQK